MHQGKYQVAVDHRRSPWYRQSFPRPIQKSALLAEEWQHNFKRRIQHQKTLNNVESPLTMIIQIKSKIICDIHTNLANLNMLWEESSLYFFPNMSALRPWHQLPQIDLEQEPFLLLVVSGDLKHMKKKMKLFTSFQVDFLNLWFSPCPKVQPKNCKQGDTSDFPKSKNQGWNRGTQGFQPCNQTFPTTCKEVNLVGGFSPFEQY